MAKEKKAPADEPTKATTEAAPEAAPAAAKPDPVFAHPVSRSFTGLVQFRSDAARPASTNFGKWEPGEVKRIDSLEGANRLVGNGHHAHAPRGTALGFQDIPAAVARAAANPREAKPTEKSDPVIDE